MNDESDRVRLADALSRVAELERTMQYANALIALSRLTENARDPDETAREALQIIAPIADVDYGGLAACAGNIVKTHTVWRSAAAPEDYVRRAEAGVAKGQSIAWAAVRRSEHLFIDDCEAWPERVPGVEAVGCRSIAAVPIGDGGDDRVLVFVAVRFGAARPWTELDRELFLAAARKVTLAVERRDQLRWFQELALTDVLTGLGNRRCFEIDLAAAISGAKRHGYPVSLLSLDIDGLKRVNDTRGHAVGDELLAGGGGGPGRSFRGAVHH
jgi:GAF domain-containing protein